MGMYAAAVTLNRLNFDILSLLAMPGFDHGGPNVHSLSPVTWLTAGAIRATADSGLGVPVLHVIHWAIGAVALAGIYTLARLILPAGPSWGVVVLATLNPIVLTQLGDIYLEIPLLAAATWGMFFLIKRRLALAATLATVATAIKPAGLAIALAMVVYLLDSGERRKLQKTVTVMSGPIVVGMVQRETLPISALFRRGWLETLEIGVFHSARILDVVALSVVAVTAGTFALRRSRLVERERDVTRAWLAIIVSFFAFYFFVPVSTVGVFLLPRYWIAVIPASLAIIVFEMWSRGRLLAVIFMGLLGAGYAVNTHGQLYASAVPEVCERNYAILERSLESLQLLELHRAEAKALEGAEDPVYLTQPLGSAVRYPEMGYIEDVPDNIHIIMSGQGWESVRVHDLDLPAMLLVESPLFGGGILFDWWKSATLATDLVVEVTTIEARPYQAALVAIRPGDSGTTVTPGQTTLRAIERQLCLG